MLRAAGCGRGRPREIGLAGSKSAAASRSIDDRDQRHTYLWRQRRRASGGVVRCSKASVATAALLIWSSIRAWRQKNSFLKWGAVGLAALLAAVVSLVSALTIAGLFKLYTRNAPVPDLNVAGTPKQIQRGQAIANSFCDACHSKTGPLTGGMDIGKDFPFPVGSFVSSNLTPAGQVNHWSDGEIFRAIRNGIDADGRWLTVNGKLSDDDIQALIAYIRSQPAARNREPAGPAKPVRGHYAGCRHASGG
jgi:cytochrome c553